MCSSGCIAAFCCASKLESTTTTKIKRNLLGSRRLDKWTKSSGEKEQSHLFVCSSGEKVPGLLFKWLSDGREPGLLLEGRSDEKEPSPLKTKCSGERVRSRHERTRSDAKA